MEVTCRGRQCYGGIFAGCGSGGRGGCLGVHLQLPHLEPLACRSLRLVQLQRQVDARTRDEELVQWLIDWHIAVQARHLPCSVRNISLKELVSPHQIV